MFELVPAPPAGPTILVPSSFGLVSLIHSSFTMFLWQRLAQAGHNPQDFSGHRFWCGGASFALSCVVPGEIIKINRDWKSECYLHYLDTEVHWYFLS